MNPHWRNMGRYAPGKEVSGMGFFTRPALETSGEHAGKMVKRYRGLTTREKAEKIIEFHDEHVSRLRGVGIRVPETRMIAEREGKGFRLKIVQEAFPAESVLSTVMLKAGKEKCVELLKAAMAEANKVISYNSSLPEGEALGFHPTLRNLVFHEGKLHYIDTFPPLLKKKGIRTEDEIILGHSLERVPEVVKKITRPFMKYITVEYYEPKHMLGGIVHSAIRRRPELKEAMLRAGTEFAEKELAPRERRPVLKMLERIRRKT